MTDPEFQRRMEWDRNEYNKALDKLFIWPIIFANLTVAAVFAVGAVLHRMGLI